MPQIEAKKKWKSFLLLLYHPSPPFATRNEIFSCTQSPNVHSLYKKRDTSSIAGSCQRQKLLLILFPHLIAFFLHHHHHHLWVNVEYTDQKNKLFSSTEPM
jgi:hypothetical protein